ncbi:MAG: hypothetical protein P1Q69_18160 [Candidatus Thorarchaeota archaeon]|nr:hypothetical protein [Candidatus Thorarchaeota archaeon]
MTEENEVATEPVVETKEETKTPVASEADQVLEKLVGVVGVGNASDMELERVVYSGDPSALPQFHYRWKRKYLADYVVRVKSVDEVKDVVAIAVS